MDGQFLVRVGSRFKDLLSGLLAVKRKVSVFKSEAVFKIDHWIAWRQEEGGDIFRVKFTATAGFSHEDIDLLKGSPVKHLKDVFLYKNIV